MTKKIVKILTFIFLALLTFFTFPVAFDLFPAKEKFLLEEPVALIPNEQNRGERCRESIVYSTEADREIHEREGYEFIVDDYCAKLQNGLIKAIENEDILQIKRLIAQGANVNVSDASTGEARYPIYKAAFKNTQILKLILDNGANVNKEFCCCASCQSPLQIAVISKNSESVKLLLERGADINYLPSFSDEKNRHLIDVSAKYSSREITDILQESCEKQLTCRAKIRFQRVADFLKLSR